MEREGQGRHAPFAFVCALLLTVGAGLGSLFPPGEAFAAGQATASPNGILDAAPSHDATTGTLAGQAGTDGGASTYRIPIVVPPGRAGMQPSLALVYNSRGGNGVAGLGWSISGLSSIHRCPQTPEQDGATRGVSYAATDRLCLDGQRLVRTTGSSYGEAGAIYRTEIDSYARITQLVGNLTGTTTAFKVEQKDGRVLTYGTTANARVLPNGSAGKPLSWLVDRIEDRVGNSQSYSYVDPSAGYGEILLGTVTYTGSPTGGAGNRTVTFTYKSRAAAAPGAKDFASSALAGGLTLQTRALEGIKTAVNGVTVRRYEPSYGVSQYSDRLLMKSIKECIGDSTTCHPATQFTYNDGALNFQLKSLQGFGLPSTVPDGEDNENYRVRLAGDYDGDGTRETVVSAKVGLLTHVYLTQFSADRTAHISTELQAPYSAVASEHILDADMDGSGRSALIGLSLDPVNVAFGLWDYSLFPRGTPATSNPFGKVPTNIPLPSYFGQIAHGQNKLVLPADVDGDGKTDIVTIYPTNQCNGGQQDDFGYRDGVFLYRNIHETPFVIGQTASFASPTKLFCLERIVGGVTFAEASIDHIGDFNGDGLADFYLVYGGALGPHAGGIAGIAITAMAPSGAVSATVQGCSQIGLLNNGTATDDCSGDQNYATRWMDVNADGLEDFVIARPTEGTWKLRINQGNGQLGPQIDTGRSEGLDKDGTGATSGPQFRFRYANRLPAMDVDADGKADLLIPSRKPGAQAFALKMCTIKRVPKITGADGSLCPAALGSEAQASFNAPETGEVCAAYSCPPNPDGSPPLPPNSTRDNRGYPYQWNTLAAFDAYSSHPNHQGPGEDNSVYHLAQLKFVQTGALSFDVSVVETPLVSRLGDYYGRADDLFGDGLPDLIGSVGCSDLVLSQAGSQTTGPWSHQKCSVVTTANGTTYGPATFPDGTPTSTFANRVVLYANINQGLSAPGGSPGGASVPASQRPVAPTLTSSGPGVSLSLPVPHLPGLMDSAIDGVGDFATWGYFPLSVRASRDQLPFYTVRSDADPNGYTDSRHYYFQSSMPVVYGMAQNAGDGSVNGFRSAFYGYTEAMYHHLGRGFQGFRTIVSNSVAPTGQSWRQLRTKTTFHQKFPLTGRIETVETTAPGTGRLITRETDTWICQTANRALCPQGDDLGNPAVNPNGGVIYTPLLDAQRTDSYDLATGAAVSHTTTVNAATASGGLSGWDSNGNLLTQVVTSADDGAGERFVAAHTVTTTHTYLPVDTGNWWLDRLSASNVTTALSYAAGRPLPSGASSAPLRSVSTSYVWNAPDRTPQSQTVTASGQTLTTAYDYAGTTAKGLPSSVTISGTGISPPRTTQFTYTKDGTAPASQQDGYFVLTTSNAAGHSARTEHAPRDGQVTVLTDPNGLRTTSTYDGFGRLIGLSFLDASGNALLKPVTIGYSRCSGSSCVGGGYGDGDNQSGAAWRVVRQQDGAPTTADWFDVLGRTIKHVERGFSETDFIETFTDHDAMGTVATASAPFYRLAGNGALTAWNYDTLNRPTQKNAPGGELDPGHGDVVTTYTYSGRQTAIKVRAAGVPGTCSANTNLCMDMSRAYDVLGRLARTVQGNGAEASYAATNYWYDGPGNPLAAQDAGGSVIRATYTDLGQRTDLDDPDAGHWHFTYDALGEVIDQTDARGVVTHHDYDMLGRLIQRTATQASAPDPTLKVIRDRWDFDPPGGKGLLNYAERQKGASAAALAPIWKESNAYESPTKRLSGQTTTLDGQPTPWTTTYTYDSFGRPFTTGYPSGLVVRKDYTSTGDLRQISNDGTGQVYWTGTAKDAWGNLTAETYLGTITGTHASYASTGQSRQKRWTQGASLLTQLDYRYDSFGNLTTQATAQPGITASETYAYDGLQRLTQTARTGVEGNPAPISYAYQANGNLAAKSDYSFSSAGSYSYGANGCGPHGVSRVGRSGGPHDYTCDANGNVAGGNTLSASYDFNNQPWRIDRLDGGGTAQFAYTANGEVFRSLAGSSNSWFGPAGYEESRIGITTTQRHELGPVVVLRQAGVETVKAMLRDRLGSQVMRISGSGGPTSVPTLSATPNPSLDGHYTIAWTPVAGASQYQLFENDQPTAVYSGAGLSWSPPSTQAVGRYSYRVRACTPTCGTLSTALVEEVAPAPPGTPALSPNPSPNGSYTLTWPASTGALAYQVEEKNEADGKFQVVSSGASVRTWSATGRPPGTYQYRVRACLTLCGNPSTVVTETVSGGGDPEAPAAPVLNPPTPNPSTGPFALSWSAPATADSYVLQERFNLGAWTNQAVTGTGIALERGNGTYEYQVRACRSVAGQPLCGPFSNLVSETVQGSSTPAAPTGVHSSQTACATGNTASVTISWNASPGATRYEVRQTNPDVDPEVTVYPTTQTSMPFTLSWPLHAGETTFAYAVRACAGSDCSLYAGNALVCFSRLNRPDTPEATPVSTAYDAFGKVRNGDYSDKPNGTLNALPDTLHGFTGHQHVDDVRLIHMNGRVYDYQLGRFLSVDPVIQFPTNTQSMNPYSYILNNPLSGRDPTGYCSTGTNIDRGDSAESCQDMGVSVTGSQPATREQQANGLLAKSLNAFAAKWNSKIAQGNGADAMGTKGASSSPLSGFASDIGKIADTAGQQVSALATAAARGMFPETARLYDQGGGSEDVSGTGVAVGIYNTASRAANEAISLAAFLYNNVHNKDFVSYEAYDPFPVFQVPQAMQKSVAIGELILSGASIFAAPERLGAEGASGGFRSFSAFKREFGPAGPGMDWHHVVGQTPGNITRFGPGAIHNTENLVRLDVATHRKISGFYSSKALGNDMTVRQWLGLQSYEEQRSFGQQVLRDFGASQ